VLNAHPAVARSAVTPEKRTGGEDLIAFVELRPGVACAMTELADFAAARLASYKRPSEFVVLETLPLTPAGKIVKSALPGVLEQRRIKRPFA
jgi:long-chain acyl-CoA synthetase